MSHALRPILFLAIVLPGSIAWADVVELKSGEKLEGRVTAHDDQSVTFEVQFSPTIVDERVIPRGEIARVTVRADDEVAFEQIRDLKSPDTAVDAQPCQKLLDDQLLPFVQKYPTSPRAADAQAMIRSIQSDVDRLKSGDVKITGIWIDATSAAAEKYQIDAARLLVAMQRGLEAKNLPEALNAFSVLQRNYPNSLAFVAALQLAPDMLEKLQQRLAYEIANLPQTRARRQAAVDRTPPEQRQPIQATIAAEDAQAAAVADLARKNQQPFYAILPYDEKGLKEMQTAATQIQTSLRATKAASLEKGADLVRRITAELDSRQFAAAQTTFEQLKEAWPDYEGRARIELRLNAGLAALKESADKTSPGVGNPKP